MSQSKYYNKVKHWYESGRWDESRVNQAVKAKWITAEEAAEILGETDQDN